MAPSNRPVVTVLGSLHLDIMVEAPDRPRKGETLPGTGWGLKCGGKGGNQAVAAARHGAAARMVGAVGDDDFGRRLAQNLASAGVDTSQVRVLPGHGSGMSVAIVDPTGDYGAIIVSGVNLAMDEAFVADAQRSFEGAQVLVLQNEVPDAANLAAARLGREAGARIVLNAAPARLLPKGVEVDVLVVNEIEAEMVSGVLLRDVRCAPAAADVLLESVPAAVITLGGEGLLLAQAGREHVRIPAHRVEVVSTHGAGDAFVGAMAARLASGDDLEAAVRFGNAAAALTVSGRVPADPEELEKAVRIVMA